MASNEEGESVYMYKDNNVCKELKRNILLFDEDNAAQALSNLTYVMDEAYVADWMQDMVSKLWKDIEESDYYESVVMIVQNKSGKVNIIIKTMDFNSFLENLSVAEATSYMNEFYHGTSVYYLADYQGNLNYESIYKLYPAYTNWERFENEGGMCHSKDDEFENLNDSLIRFGRYMNGEYEDSYWEDPKCILSMECEINSVIKAINRTIPYIPLMAYPSPVSDYFDENELTEYPRIMWEESQGFCFIAWNFPNGLSGMISWEKNAWF